MSASVDVARKAVERRAWSDARDAFHEVEQEMALTPQDLELLADAAWWSGEPDETVEALERAFAGHIDQGSNLDAARVAVLLAYLAARRLAMSVVAGWVGRAHRLLEGEPEAMVHAELKVVELIMAFFGGDLAASPDLADETIELARRVGNRDSESEATALKGAMLIMGGQWKEGLALMDEATAAAVSGELNLRVASDIYCQTISACRSMADFKRAGEWTEEADRWMIRNSVTGYTGVCSVHRAELKRLHGNWTEAEEEARAACAQLEKYHILDGVGFAHYEVGEVRFRTGDYVGADEAFVMAYENGQNPYPGLALLMLARGEADDAAAALARALKESGSTNLLARANMLPAQVEVALARDDIDTARATIAELEMIAEEFERPAFEAATLTAKGQLALHLSDPEHAADHLERAWRLWKEVDFPYETARARMLLGQARAAGGDRGSARMELGAARSTFLRLGAAPDLRRVEELLYESRTEEVERTRVTKTLVFTDIVTSTDLVGLIGDEAWEKLLQWHDKELPSRFASHRGEVVSHTGDGYFVAFDKPSDAIDAAVSIQRKLAEHRRDTGFALMVRIGIHHVEVTREGADYRGQGVHAAARVGAVAGGEEIAVTRAVLDAAGELKFEVSEPRLVELKGISDPVEVALVDWR